MKLYERKHLSKEQQLRLVTDINGGLSKQDAANKYGIALSTVYAILARYTDEIERNNDETN